jgi:hypothetical protein
MPAAAKASRRSTHVPQRPQCLSPACYSYRQSEFIVILQKIPNKMEEYILIVGNET